MRQEPSYTLQILKSTMKKTENQCFSVQAVQSFRSGDEREEGHFAGGEMEAKATPAPNPLPFPLYGGGCSCPWPTGKEQPAGSGSRRCSRRASPGGGGLGQGFQAVPAHALRLIAPCMQIHGLELMN